MNNRKSDTMFPNLKDLVKNVSSARRAILVFGLLDILLVGSACSGPRPTFTSEPRTEQATSTYTVTSTAEGIAPMVIDQNCWAKQPSRDATNSIAGSLIISREDLARVIALDMKTLTSKPIGNWQDDVGVSPNRNMLVVSDKKNHNLSILTQSQILVFPIPEDTYAYIEDIFSDSRIRLGNGEYPPLSKNYDENAGYTDGYYLISPETGQTTFHSMFLPHYWGSSQHANSFIVYSPDLKYVVYTASVQNEYNTVLLNVESSEVVWVGPGIGAPSSTEGVVSPVWRPNSREVTLILRSSKSSADENFYSLSVDGTLLKMTQLEKVINPPYSLRSPTWSQDGRYLAFTVWSGPIYTLYIFDTLQRDLINTCLTTDTSKTDYNSLWYEMVWSPNDQYLAVFKPAGGVNYTISILDIDREINYEFPYEVSKLGLTSLLGWVSWEIH